MDETTTRTAAQPHDSDTWYAEVEREASRELGHGAVLKELADDATWEWLREELTPAEAVAWVLAGPEDPEPGRNYERELLDWT